LQNFLNKFPFTYHSPTIHLPFTYNFPIPIPAAIGCHRLSFQTHLPLLFFAILPKLRQKPLGCWQGLIFMGKTKNHGLRFETKKMFD
jgi:hypothetical protein